MWVKVDQNGKPNGITYIVRVFNGEKWEAIKQSTDYTTACNLAIKLRKEDVS